MLTNPVIMLVDDEPQGLTALLGALAKRFGGDYRVVSHLSATAALKDLRRVKAEGGQAALVIAGLRMPEMPGIEFLKRAHEIHPSAQRALLVEWTDRTASPTIIQGCAFGQIDNYLHRPWSPPEIYLYPMVNQFLADWTRAHGPAWSSFGWSAKTLRRGHTKFEISLAEPGSLMVFTWPGRGRARNFSKGLASMTPACRPSSSSTGTLS